MGCYLLGHNVVSYFEFLHIALYSKLSWYRDCFSSFSPNCVGNDSFYISNLTSNAMFISLSHHADKKVALVDMMG